MLGHVQKTPSLCLYVGVCLCERTSRGHAAWSPEFQSTVTLRMLMCTPLTAHIHTHSSHQHTYRSPVDELRLYSNVLFSEKQKGKVNANKKKSLVFFFFFFATFKLRVSLTCIESLQKRRFFYDIAFHHSKHPHII